MREGLAPPPYLPVLAHAVLPWCRRYVVKISTRDAVPLGDLWDEAMSALVRACAYYDASPGSASKGNGHKAFSTYACNSVIRGCWRYAERAHRRSNTRLGMRLSLQEFVEDQMSRTDHRLASHRTPEPLRAPSAEEEAMAREQARDFVPQAVISAATARLKNAAR